MSVMSDVLGPSPPLQVVVVVDDVVTLLPQPPPEEHHMNDYSFLVQEWPDAPRHSPPHDMASQ